MTAKIIDGARLAEQIRAEVAREVVGLKHQYGVTPGFVAVLVGDDPGSVIYVNNKGRACQEAGIFTETVRLPATASQQEVLQLLERLNQDSRFHGILVQSPLPPHMDEPKVMASISPDKDVDGFHPINMGRLALGAPRFIPCTPSGVQQMLLRYDYSPEGKRVVICGRSNIVGKPLAMLLLQKRPGANATVTVCHTGTRDMANITRQADILIAAMGRARAISADMVREGAVVIDVGINRIEDKTRKSGSRLVGDVDFDSVKDKIEAISPVPGGVGPMTIAMLLVNTVKAAKLAQGLQTA